MTRLTVCEKKYARRNLQLAEQVFNWFDHAVKVASSQRYPEHVIEQSRTGRILFSEQKRGSENRSRDNERGVKRY